jgi:hypothetical protein
MAPQGDINMPIDPSSPLGIRSTMTVNLHARSNALTQTGPEKLVAPLLVASEAVTPLEVKPIQVEANKPITMIGNVHARSESSPQGRPEKSAATAASAAAVKPVIVVNDPCPVTYLKRLFTGTDKGRELIRNPRRSLFTKPSQEFTDSYDMDVVRAIREKDLPTLRSMLKEGKSFNASNRFGESLMHMACRRGCLEVVNFLIHEAQVQVDVQDDFGRTALHDACWTAVPNFAVMDAIIKQVPPDMLLSEDVRGHTPFHYARKEHWDDWVKFLRDRDKFLLRRLDIVVQTVG